MTEDDPKGVPGGVTLPTIKIGPGTHSACRCTQCVETPGVGVCCTFITCGNI
jgi:hypothetical protein